MLQCGDRQRIYLRDRHTEHERIGSGNNATMTSVMMVALTSTPTVTASTTTRRSARIRACSMPCVLL